MKNFSERLRDLGPLEPRRPLRSDFTQSIIERLPAHPHATGLWGRIKEYYTMKFTNPAARLAAVTGVALLIGGTSYATAVNWPAITSALSGSDILPNGNRVVNVSLSNCPIKFDNEIGALDKGLQPELQNAQRVAYFEVKRSSQLTNEQVVAEAQGQCEAAASSVAANKVLQNFQVPAGYAFDGGERATIKELAAGRLVVALNLGNGVTDTLTYTNLAPGMLVYDGNQKIDLNALVAGDSVDIVSISPVHSGGQAETPSSAHKKTTDSLVVGLVKQSATHAGKPGFNDHVGREYIPVRKNAAVPGGYERVYSPESGFDN
jgi:hypothetical protein